MENSFIPYEKALSILGEHKGDFPIESKDLEDCIGTYLAEDLIADRDFPPFESYWGKTKNVPISVSQRICFNVDYGIIRCPSYSGSTSSPI